MPALGELFLDSSTTLRAYLAGVLWINLHHCASSILRFVCAERDELMPTSISYGFVEARFGTGTVRQIVPCRLILLWLSSPGQVCRGNILKHDDFIAIHQPAAVFVQGVVALVACLSVQRSH